MLISRFAALGGGSRLNNSLRFALSSFSSTSSFSITQTEFTPLSVSSNTVIGKNVHKISLSLPVPDAVLPMTTAGMLLVREIDRNDSTKEINRPYTPVSWKVGSVDLIVKNYPDGGNVSTSLIEKRVGETVEVMGCFSKIEVNENKWKRVGLVAGGSGLTPCLQVVTHLLSLPSDKTDITMVFANKSESELFWEREIDGLVESSKGRFRVKYLFDDVDGFVDKDAVVEYLPPPAETNIIMVCGPPPMYDSICGPKIFVEDSPPQQGEVGGLLSELGYTKEMVFKF